MEPGAYKDLAYTGDRVRNTYVGLDLPNPIISYFRSSQHLPRHT